MSFIFQEKVQLRQFGIFSAHEKSDLEDHFFPCAGKRQHWDSALHLHICHGVKVDLFVVAINDADQNKLPSHLRPELRQKHPSLKSFFANFFANTAAFAEKKRENDLFLLASFKFIG